MEGIFMLSKRVSFKNRQGIVLSAIIDLPDNEKVTCFSLMAHCFTCSKVYKIYHRMSEELTEHGMGVMRLDFTGLGESHGDFSATTFTSNVHDLIDACNYLTENFIAPSLLIGHSLGGLAAIKAASSLPSVKGLATIGSPYGLSNIKKRFLSYAFEINSRGKATIDVAGRPFTIKRDFLTDLKGQELIKDLKELKQPIIIFHAIHDKVVSYQQGLNLFNTASSPKSFVSLPSANHLVSNRDDATYIAQVITQWITPFTANIKEV